MVDLGLQDHEQCYLKSRKYLLVDCVKNCGRVFLEMSEKNVLLLQTNLKTNKKNHTILLWTALALALVAVVIVIVILSNKKKSSSSSSNMNPYPTLSMDVNTITTLGLWTTPTTWAYNSVPDATKDVQLRIANNYLVVTPGSVSNSLSVGEHGLNCVCQFQDGADLTTGPVFLGQYIDGQGIIKMGQNTTLNCTNLTVGGQGTGTLTLTENAVINVSGTLTLNLYSQTTLAPASIIMSGDSVIYANTLSNPKVNTSILMDGNARIILQGNQTTKTTAALKSGQIKTLGTSLPGLTQYFASNNVTMIYSPSARDVGLMSLPSYMPLDYNYYGVLQPTQVKSLEHPRVFFSPSDLADINNRLATTNVGKDALITLRTFTGLLNNGRGWYNVQPTRYIITFTFFHNLKDITQMDHQELIILEHLMLKLPIFDYRLEQLQILHLEMLFWQQCCLWRHSIPTSCRIKHERAKLLLLYIIGQCLQTQIQTLPGYQTGDTEEEQISQLHTTCVIGHVHQHSYLQSDCAFPRCAPSFMLDKESNKNLA